MALTLSEKTKLEMEAGARQLAQASGAQLPPGYMEAIVRTHERNAQLRRWEKAGKIEIESTGRVRVGSVRYKRDVTEPPETWHTMIHVMPKAETPGPTFTDLDAERTGGFPSEVLIANIALYLQSVGEL